MPGLEAYNGREWQCVGEGGGILHFEPKPKPEEWADYPALEPSKYDLLESPLKGELCDTLPEEIGSLPVDEQLPHIYHFLGFGFSNNIFYLPTTPELEGRWADLMKHYPEIQPLNIVEVSGIADHLAFVRPYSKDFIVCSSGIERVHDMNAHVRSEIERIFRAGTKPKYKEDKTKFHGELEEGLCRIDAYEQMLADGKLEPWQILSEDELKFLKLSLGLYTDIGAAGARWTREAAYFDRYKACQHHGSGPRSALFGYGELDEERKYEFLIRSGLSEEFAKDSFTACRLWDFLWSITAEKMARPDTIGVEFATAVLASHTAYSGSCLVSGDTFLFTYGLSDPKRVKKFKLMIEVEDGMVTQSYICSPNGLREIGRVDGDIRRGGKLPESLSKRLKAVVDGSLKAAVEEVTGTMAGLYHKAKGDAPAVAPSLVLARSRATN